MRVPPEELLERLGVHTPLYAVDQRRIFAVLNDREKGHFFAVDRESGNFCWRVENASGWVMAPPLIWGDLYVVGTSEAQMNREECGGEFATVDWKRGGSLYAFAAEDGAVRFGTKERAWCAIRPGLRGTSSSWREKFGWGAFAREKPGLLPPR